MVYGLASVAGSFVGGHLADADPARALVIVTLGLAMSGAPLLAPGRSSRGCRRCTPGICGSAGIALGSTLSGITYEFAGPSAVVLTGLIIALVALSLAVATRRLEPAAVTASSGCVNPVIGGW